MPAPRRFPARRGLGGTGGGARRCPKIHSRAEGGDPAAAFGLAPHQCEQRERRGAGVRRCNGLGKGGEAPERDEQRVLAVRGHGLAEEKLLRLLGWARPGQGAALCREGAPCPVTGRANVNFPPRLAVRLRGCRFTCPGARRGFQAAPRVSPGAGGRRKAVPELCRAPRWEESPGGWTGDHGERAGSHGSIHLAVPRIFTG